MISVAFLCSRSILTHLTAVVQPLQLNKEHVYFFFFSFFLFLSCINNSQKVRQKPWDWSKPNELDQSDLALDQLRNHCRNEWNKILRRFKDYVSYCEPWTLLTMTSTDFPFFCVSVWSSRRWAEKSCGQKRSRSDADHYFCPEELLTGRLLSTNPGARYLRGNVWSSEQSGKCRNQSRWRSPAKKNGDLKHRSEFAKCFPPPRARPLIPLVCEFCARVQLVSLRQQRPASLGSLCRWILL